ncbi:MAG: helix-turn-helix transcriptional regulator [Verrucomicrobiales bacterium]|nr:helix-turn-helix transcriptional regulator [Verrucomicrobiales bacterium]
MAKRFRNCVGPQVRTLRKKKDLTQDQLAARLQLAGLHSFDRVTVAKIESQIRSVFDFELAILADVLGVSSEELLPSRRKLKDSLDDLIAGEK